MNPSQNQKKIGYDLLFAGERYKIADKMEPHEGKIYLQTIFLPTNLLVKFMRGIVKLDVAFNYESPITPDSKWTAWGNGKFFHSFKNSELKIGGICFAPCDSELLSVPTNRDLCPLVDFLTDGKNGFYTRRMQIAAKAKNKQHKQANFRQKS